MIEFAECQSRNHDSMAFENPLSYHEHSSDFKYSVNDESSAKKEQINYDVYSQQLAFDSSRDHKWASACQTQRYEIGCSNVGLNEKQSLENSTEDTSSSDRYASWQQSFNRNENFLTNTANGIADALSGTKSNTFFPTMNINLQMNVGVGITAGPITQSSFGFLDSNSIQQPALVSATHSCMTRQDPNNGYSQTTDAFSSTASKQAQITNWENCAENGFASENHVQEIPPNGSVRFVAKAAFTAYWSRPSGSSEMSGAWSNNEDFGGESRIPGPSTAFQYGPNEPDNSYESALGWQEQAESNSSELLTSSDEDGEHRGPIKNREFDDSISTTGSEIDSVAKSNVCFVCGKAYARPSTLKTHLRTHSGERPYKCLTCNKTFSQAANLTAHLRTHSGEKPFKCGICERRFSQSSSVTTHMRTHNGERPYRCRVCRKSFSDSSTLTKHMRVHSGEKPYHCSLCFAKFSQSGNLNRHLRVHMANGTYFAAGNCPR